MKSITLVLMAYVFVSNVFELANAKNTIANGVSYGDASTDNSKHTYAKDKNQYTEQTCKANSYTRHFLVGDCIAFCHGSTIKDRAPRNINLPEGTPCINGQKCKDGYCGGPSDENSKVLKIIDKYIDESETLKGLDPALIASIKSELRKFKPEKVGQVHPYIKRLGYSFVGLLDLIPKKEQFHKNYS